MPSQFCEESIVYFRIVIDDCCILAFSVLFLKSPASVMVGARLHRCHLV